MFYERGNFNLGGNPSLLVTRQEVRLDKMFELLVCLTIAVILISVVYWAKG